MTDIILHHYDVSPFSEKVRLLFGLKKLAWKSVIQPVIMPKPDLIPLTGGYRKIPVMQIGADVFCDSQVIMAEIERRAPEPKASLGPSFAINLWADRLFFQTTIPVLFGQMEEGQLDPAFIEDRTKLSGQPFNIAAMKAASGLMKGPWRAQCAWLEQALATSGGDWLFGTHPSIGDFSAYMNFWFLGGAQPATVDALLEGMPKVQAWRKRVAAIGHGQRTNITPADALAVAKAAEPAITVPHDPNDPSGIKPGEAAVVMADDYGRDPLAGKLVAANQDRVIIARTDPQLGRLHLHVPRMGFILMRAT
jgi:glutathione S-transferase